MHAFKPRRITLTPPTYSLPIAVPNIELSEKAFMVPTLVQQTGIAGQAIKLFRWIFSGRNRAILASILPRSPLVADGLFRIMIAEMYP